MRRIRVVFIQRSVPPDHSAAGCLLFDLATGLDPQRFDVTILSTRVPPDASSDERIAGIRIVRTAALKFSRSSVVGRLVGQLGAWAMLIRGAVRLGTMDVVVTMTDPPMIAAFGAGIARLRGCRHVHWAMDLYPEVAAAGGVLEQDSALYRLLEAVGAVGVRASNEVIAIGRCMADHFALRGVVVRVIPNWSRIETASVEDDVIVEYRTLLEANGRMLLLYSGNLGLVHDFETILDAAELLHHRRANAVIGVVGEGPRGDWLRGEAARRGLENMRFLPSQPWNRFPSLLAAADAHIVTLKPEFGGLVVPSKLYDAAASGRPILFVGPASSEAARVIEECVCGAAIPNGAAREFADCVERWIADAEERRVLGENAAALSRRFSREKAVEKFSEVLGGGSSAL